MSKSIAYDFPLRPDFLANLLLPPDLTVAEVGRLKAFLDTLARPIVEIISVENGVVYER